MEASNPKLTLHDVLQQVAANASGNGNASTATSGTTSAPRTEAKDKYNNVEKVKTFVLFFVGVTGVSVAWKTVQPESGILDFMDWFMFAGQVAGFCASTLFLYILSKGIREGKYTGDQFRYAKGLYFWGVCFESLTIFAKYFDGFVEPYLFVVAFTIPGLAIAISRLIYLDKELQVQRVVEENAKKKAYLQEMETALGEQLVLNQRIKSLRIKEFASLREDDEVLRLATGRLAKKLIKSNATERVQKLLGAKTGKEVTIKQSKGNGVLNKARTKLIGEGTTIEVREKQPKKGRKGGRPCKNPECTNKLTGKQQYYCSKACAAKVSRMRKKERELETATA